jgi:hypothetical protein
MDRSWKKIPFEDVVSTNIARRRTLYLTTAYPLVGLLFLITFSKEEDYGICSYCKLIVFSLVAFADANSHHLYPARLWMMKVEKLLVRERW